MEENSNNHNDLQETIWPPKPRSSGIEAKAEMESHTVVKRIPIIFKGILVGFVGGAVVSLVVLIIKTVIGWHCPYFYTHPYIYYLAVLIEVGIGYALFPKNKFFALSSTLVAVCVSVVLALLLTFLDGFGVIN